MEGKTSVSRSIRGFDSLILNYSDRKEFNTPCLQLRRKLKRIIMLSQC
jgi:hypothetical protein